MKWVLRSAAPAGKRGEHWGDLFFARSLAGALGALGEDVSIERYGEWGGSSTADVVLLLRGRFRDRGHKGKKNLIWILSHPGEIGLDELSSYDAVFSASSLHADLLAKGLGRSVSVLLQCTDFAAEGLDFTQRSDYVFVGNSRFVERRSVFWAIDAGLPLKVWGSGWAHVLPKENLQGSYVSNQDLRTIYGGARAVLNDHWAGMRRFGYINNRVFDALACETPVLSDRVEGADAVFGDGVLQFGNRKEFEECLERLLLDGPDCYRLAIQAAKGVAEQHSFLARAKTLIAEASEL